MPEPLLELRALDAFYGDFQALFGVSLAVATEIRPATCPPMPW